PELFRVTNGTDVNAESLVDALALAKCELRAAAAGVEHDQRASWNAQPFLYGEVCQPTLFLTRDYLDRNPRSLPNRFSRTDALLHSVSRRILRCSRFVPD